MKQFTICTLVDITKTGQYRRETGKEKEKSQQQNFDMVMQTIGMRTNASYVDLPFTINEDINNRFGTSFSNTHRIWIFNFFIEHLGTLTDENGNPCGLLINDLNLVPIIADLDETAKFNQHIFNTKCPIECNTIIFPSDYKY